MTAEKGLKSVKVNVDSSSDEMMEQLAAVADEYPGVDLVNGCEVVGNQNLVAFLASLGKTITVPAIMLRPNCYHFRPRSFSDHFRSALKLY